MTRSTVLLASLALLGACKDDKGITEDDLGSYTTDTGGLTGPIDISVPDGTSSVMFHCGPYGNQYLGTAWEIVDPDGNTWYSNSYFPGHVSTQMRVGNHDDYLPVLMPVSPDHDISSGDWSINVWVASQKKPLTIDCGVVYGEGEPGDTATVDLHIVLVGIDGLDASSAEGDADLQSLLDTVDGIWSGRGLSIGDVTYEDFSGDLATYSVIDLSDDDASELNALFRTADPPDPQSLVMFLVQDISNASGSVIYGLAAGPPGAATITGTSKSGMVINAADLRDDTDFVALVAAHEGAHFLGLFHTSEKDGGTHDPLSDTAECPSSSDSNGDGYVSASECAGKGGDNVMFWSPPAGTTDLTHDQGWVVRRNPAAK